MGEPRSPCRSSPAAASDGANPPGPELENRRLGSWCAHDRSLLGAPGQGNGKAGGVAFIQHQQGGRPIQIEGAQYLLHQSGIGAELGEVQGDSVSDACSGRRCFGLRATHQHRRRRQRLLRHASAIVADVGRKLCRVHRSTAREDDPGLVEQHAAPRDAVALEPGALVPSRLEPELPELVRHILSGHVEATTRRVPAQHGVIGNDADTPGNILRRDRGDRPVERCAGLGHSRGSAEEDKEECEGRAPHALVPGLGESGR